MPAWLVRGRACAASIIIRACRDAFSFSRPESVLMAIDLTALSPKELDTLIAEAKRRKTILKKRKPIASIRKRIVDFATAEGYTIQELFGPGATVGRATAKAAKKTARKTTAGRKVPPKYRNPANPAETWTGRGKHPRWLAAQLAKGKKLEDFLIKKK
ncbi:H-NS family nucleoid-associated regulatory protein [Luteimonas wenzhouensis]|jgi:DNA-binding protein H-NS|nr:H-NS histone family protein [Luteimonas wenzhouensis]